METIRRFLKDERGTETVEWAIIIGLIGTAAIAAAIIIGPIVTNQFTDLSTEMQKIP